MTFGVARIGMCGLGGAGRDKPVPYGSTSFVPGVGPDKREAMLLARSGIGP